MMYKFKTAPIRLTAKIGDLIDYYYDIREEKRLLKKWIGEIDAKMKKVENAAFDKMKKQKVASSRAGHAQGSISKKTTYKVTDWDEFWSYAKRKNNQDLLSQSCSGSAIKEREEDGVKVPGVEKNTYVYLSVTKL